MVGKIETIIFLVKRVVERLTLNPTGPMLDPLPQKR